MKLATIEEYEKIEEGMTKELERLQAELKAMKESCTCKGEVGEAPVGKRTKSKQSQKP